MAIQTWQILNVTQRHTGVMNPEPSNRNPIRGPIQTEHMQQMVPLQKKPSSVKIQAFDKNKWTKVSHCEQNILCTSVKHKLKSGSEKFTRADLLSFQIIFWNYFSFVECSLSSYLVPRTCFVSFSFWFPFALLAPVTKRENCVVPTLFFSKMHRSVIWRQFIREVSMQTHVRASVFHAGTHVAMCPISVAISWENWPIYWHFCNTTLTTKSFCKYLRNLRKNICVEHDEFSLLNCLFPRFLGRFLAREMGRTFLYPLANDTAGCIETSPMMLDIDRGLSVLPEDGSL